MSVEQQAAVAVLCTRAVRPYRVLQIMAPLAAGAEIVRLACSWQVIVRGRRVEVVPSQVMYRWRAAGVIRPVGAQRFVLTSVGVSLRAALLGAGHDPV
jgi:nicotinate-nucleotide pyrophosphorylase